MKAKVEHFSATNPSPVLSMLKDGTVIYSNDAGGPLLHEWGTGVGEKLPLNIVDIVQRVISRNSPEKMEVKAGKRVYLVDFHPLPKLDCVNISGFDISARKEFEDELRESKALEMADLELAEIIDAQAIQSLMDDFYRLAHIPMSIDDLKGNVLVGVGWQDICTKFHRINPETCKHCVESSTTLSKGVLHGEFKQYMCKNNMWHIATPIMVSGQHVGNIISGQFFFEDEPLDYELFRSKARKYGFNEKEYMAALEKVPRLSRKAVDTGISFFMKLANLISQLSYSNTRLAHLLFERDALFKSLQTSELKYRSIVETAIEGLWIFNSVSETTYVNEKMAEILGYNREEMIGSFIWDYADEVDKDFFQVRLANRKQGIDEVYECKLLRKNGSPVWLLVSAKASFDKDGKFLGSLSMFTDITERKLADQALRESEERFRSAFDDSAVAMALVGPDARLLKVNDAFCRMLGFEKSEMESLTFLDFTYPDDKEPSISTHKAVMDREKPFFWLEKRYIRKDGRVIWCEVSSSPVLDSKGCPIYTVAHAQDITERKEAEEALQKSHETLEEKVKERTTELERAYNSLKESEEKYRNIVETANEGISLIDSEGMVIYVNKKLADMLEYSPEEFIGRPTWDFVATEDVLKNKSKIEKRRLGISESYEIKLIRKSGSSLWVFINAKSIFDENGKFIGSLSMHTDITKRKEAEEALNNIEIARKKEIHHRIKNNLQVISSLLDLQAEKFKDRDKIRNSEIQEAFRESQSRVISMALIHEELHKGEGFEKLNFSSYIKELADNLFLTYRLGNNDINLNMELDQNVFLDMDIAIPLGIIINELVSNSLKHAFLDRNVGEIRIKLHREEDSDTSFILTISDNGVGIPQDLDIEKLDSLGLQLVTSLIDQLEGELELKRENGIEFIIKFTVKEGSNRSSGQLQSSE